MQKCSFWFYFFCGSLVFAALLAVPKAYFLIIHKLAYMGHITSFRRLADCYYKGRGTTPDLLQAKYWYEQASDERRDPVARRCLGDLYSHAAGVQRTFQKASGFWNAFPLDYEKAAQWYLLAAQQGSRSAQYRLGFMYRKGLGVPRDYKKAFKWFMVSAQQGFAPAQDNLGDFYCHMLGRPEYHELVPGFWKGIEENYAKSVEWYTKAAEQGCVTAQRRLGFMYSYGYGTVKGNEEIFLNSGKNLLAEIEWDTMAYLLDQRDYFSSYEKEFASGQGDGTEPFVGIERDFQKAFEWYKKAADQGCPRSQWRVGYFYANGKGVDQDDALAFEWYLKSAQQGFYIAQQKVGVCYEYGRGVEQSYDKALEWYIKFASFYVTSELDDLFKQYNVTPEQHRQVFAHLQDQMAHLTLETMGNIRALACARVLATVEIDPADTETKILFR